MVQRLLIVKVIKKFKIINNVLIYPYFVRFAC